jgi:hypothetical protein
MIPMYITDVHERMRRPDPKGQTWQWYSDVDLKRFGDADSDSTRAARMRLSEDPTRQRAGVSSYDVVWIHRHIHRYRGEDYQWYTIGSEKRLTEPEPLKRSVLHGKRPYVMGKAILETHKPMPMSVPELGKSLQEDLNDTRNQRHDNVLLSLNKRFFVKRGQDTDMASLIRNVPGGITLTNNPEVDIKEVSWPDVTQSSYLEEDRIVGNFDELLGNFNPMQLSQTRGPRESERTMMSVQTPAAMLTEYLLKTFVETFVLPVVRLLLLLEQRYETDATVLAIAGEKAKLREKFGVDEITDHILRQELTTQINVGMGATDPVMRLQRFSGAVLTYAKVAAKPPPGLDLGETWKELAALSGYQDGSRFISTEDPEKAALAQENQQLKQILKQKVGDKSEANQVRREGNVLTFKARREATLAKLLGQDREHTHDKLMFFADHVAGQDDAAQQEQYTRTRPAPAPQEALSGIGPQ